MCRSPDSQTTSSPPPPPPPQQQQYRRPRRAPRQRPSTTIRTVASAAVALDSSRRRSLWFARLVSYGRAARQNAKVSQIRVTARPPRRRTDRTSPTLFYYTAGKCIYANYLIVGRVFSTYFRWFLQGSAPAPHPPWICRDGTDTIFGGRARSFNLRLNPPHGAGM